VPGDGAEVVVRWLKERWESLRLRLRRWRWKRRAKKAGAHDSIYPLT
jgi:hypothetical protein